jgi:TPR repeat protein
MKWCSRAANQGYVFAQSRLGGMYENRRGVPPDYVRAHMWYNLAAVAAEPNFREFLVVQRYYVEMKMTVAQITAAQTLASEWRPQPE